jgi:hypothetical protein
MRSIAIPWNRHGGAALTICGDLSMRTKRIEIIPALHGKLTHDGKLSEPDIYYILEKWLERHRTFKRRENEIRVVRGRWTLREGIRTEVVSVSGIENEDIAGYDPAQDRDLYEYIWRKRDTTRRCRRQRCQIVLTQVEELVHETRFR